MLQVGLGEECDDGNTSSGDGCSATCVGEFCGDGTVQSALGEECDDGNNASGDGCSGTCTLESICGNGVLESGEACDDGNTDPGDGCNATCQEEYCGDGIVQAGIGETCDDGNTSSGDGCNSSCQDEYCGDGITQSNLGEECDDGDNDSGDGCNASCQNEYCGDGIVQSGLGEQCDDGGTQPNDGCNPSCQNEYCGDGVTQTALGEECDDGDNSSGDGCNASCQEEYCGDGIVQSGLGEECDDGNNNSGDGCSSNCQSECDPTLNLALSATAYTSGGGSGDYGPASMNDDYDESQCQTYRYCWVSAPDSPSGDWIEYRWSSPVTVASLFIDTQLWSDYTCVDGTQTGRTLAGGTIQYWNGSSYVSVGTVSNQSDDWSYSLSSPVQTTRLRINGVHASTLGSQDSNPVIFEWQVFECD